MVRFVWVLLAIVIVVSPDFITIQPSIHILDYIIVGAGAGGSVLAKKFSTDPTQNILVLDVGDYCGQDCNTLEAIETNVWSSKIDTLFPIPQSWAFGRSPMEQTYLGPGGSTNIYAATYTRASPYLLNQYPAGFQYNDLLPYYKQNEDHYCYYLPNLNPTGYNYPSITPANCLAYHGKGGPMEISPQQYQYISPQINTLLSAGRASTLFPPFSPDPNGNSSSRYGLFFEQNFRNRANLNDIASARSKVNVFDSFLPKSYLSTRPNLIIKTNSKVEHLILEGNRVIGVEYINKGFKIVAYARKQIFLSAGAMKTPQILQLNGIGPSPLLNSFNISVKANNPGVGTNLAAHQGFTLGYQTNTVVPHDFAITSVSVAGGFLYSSPAVAASGGSPDIQLEIQEGIFPEYIDVAVTGDPKAITATLLQSPPFPFIGFVVSNVRPVTRGTISIQSTDPNAAPLLDYGWNSNVDSTGDSTKLIAALEQVRGFVTSLGSIIAREIWPGTTFTSLLSILDSTWSSTPLQQQQGIADTLHIKNTIHPIYHLTGSCSMGTITTSCTDINGRVRGVTGLSVCDNSILPIPPDANPTATLLAVCAKVADWHLANVAEYTGPWPKTTHH